MPLSINFTSLFDVFEVVYLRYFTGVVLKYFTAVLLSPLSFISNYLYCQYNKIEWEMQNFSYSKDILSSKTSNFSDF